VIETSISPTSVTLAVVGDLDMAERDQLPRVAAQVLGQPRPQIVVDMCRVTFMDSTGAGFLIHLAEAQSQRGGTTVLRGINARDEFVLKICGALELFQVEQDHRCVSVASQPSGAATSGL